MSKVGKAGTIVFFILSIGAVISALKIIGNIEEGRVKIESLSLSLEGKEAELAIVAREKVALEEQLESERKLKKEIQKRMAQRINELQKMVDREKEERISWENKFDKLAKANTGLEREYKEAQQAILNLRELLKGVPDDIKPQVTGTTPPVILSPSEGIGGKVMAVVSPLLSIELDEDMVADIRPTIFVYRRGKLIKELATKGIRYMTLIARAGEGESLEGIRGNDRVGLSLSPGAAGIFNSPSMEGKVLDVIRPGFLNIDLGKEGLKDVAPTLLVYRGGELFRKIELKDMDHLTIVVETIGKAGIKGVREKDIVKIVR